MSYTYSLKWETIRDRDASRILVSRIKTSSKICDCCGQVTTDNEILTYAREVEFEDSITFGCGILKSTTQVCTLASEACGLLSALVRPVSRHPLSSFELLPVFLHLANAEWEDVPDASWDVFTAILVTRNVDGTLTIGVRGKLS